MSNGTESYASQYANRHFWLGSLDRAVAALGQTAVVFFTAGISGILEVDPIQLFSVLGLSVAASVATSLAYPKRVINGDLETQETAKIIEEYLREIYKDGSIQSRNTDRITHYSVKNEDGTFKTRRQIREERGISE